MRRSFFKSLTSLALVCLISCGGGPDRVEITETATRSPHRGPVQTDASSAERFGFSMQPPAMTASASQQVDVPLHWDTPEGWHEVPATQYRMANFVLGPSLDTECYLSVLSNGGGGAFGNVNRWRGQMGLAPYTEEEFQNLPTRTLLGPQAVMVDFEGAFKGVGQSAAKPDYRMLGVLAEHGGTGIFVKMVGPTEVVAKEVDNFEAFLDSVHLAAGGHAHADAPPAPSPPAASDAASADGFAWRVPEGWTQSADRPMRLVTYSAGESASTEAYVTVLGGEGGGLLMNLNRWLGQFGEPPMTEAQLADLPAVTILETTAPLLEVRGDFGAMGAAPKPGQALFGVACLLDGQAVFVKMTGPESDVAAQKENFIAFCESIHRH